MSLRALTNRLSQRRRTITAANSNVDGAALSRRVSLISSGSTIIHKPATAAGRRHTIQVGVSASAVDGNGIDGDEFDVSVSSAVSEFESALASAGVKWTMSARISSAVAGIRSAHRRAVDRLRENGAAVTALLSATNASLSATCAELAEVKERTANAAAATERTHARALKAAKDSAMRAADERVRIGTESVRAEYERNVERTVDERVSVLRAAMEENKRAAEETARAAADARREKVEAERADADTKRRDDDARRSRKVSELEAKVRSAAETLRETEIRRVKAVDDAAAARAEIVALKKTADAVAADKQRALDKLTAAVAATAEQADAAAAKYSAAKAQIVDLTSTNVALSAANTTAQRALAEADRRHATEVETISKRVRAVLAKKDAKIDALTADAAAATTKAAALSAALIQQRAELAAMNAL